MPDQTESLSGKVGLDTTDFKNGISEMNRDIKVIESGFKASAAALGDWAQSATGLESRIKSLSSEIEVQQKIVDSNVAQYNKLVAVYGDNSKAAEDQAIKVNQSTERLNHMKSELTDDQSALNGMTTDTTQAGKSVQELGDKSEQTKGKMLSLKDVAGGLKSVLGGVVTVAKDCALAIAAVAGAAVAVGTAVSGMVVKDAESAESLELLHEKTGLSLVKLQEMQYVAANLGLSLEDLTNPLSKLIRGMASAQDGTKSFQKDFKELGVSYKDSKGNLLDANTVFANTIQALGKMKDPTQADALAMALFGKSAMELNPLIGLTSQKMTELIKQGHESGAIVPDSAIDQAADLNKQISSLKLSFGGVTDTILAGVVPAISGAVGQVQDFLTRFKDISQMGGNNTAVKQGLMTGLIGDIGKSATEMMGAGITLLQGLVQGIIAAIPVLLPAVIALIKQLMVFIITEIPLLMQAGEQLLMGLLNGIIAQLPLLLLQGATMLVTLLTGIENAIPQMVPVVVEVINDLLNFLITQLPQIVQAGVGILTALMNGLTKMAPTLIPQLVILIGDIATILIENAPALLTAATVLLAALIQGMIAALPILITEIPTIVQAICNAITTLANTQAPVTSMQLIGMLASGIASAAPLALDAIGKIITSIMTALHVMINQMGSIGVQIVQGVWAGISSQAATFLKEVTDFFTSIVHNVKKGLGINSPSIVFAEIGKNMVLGLDVGFSNQMNEVEKRIRLSMGSIAGQAGSSSVVSSSVSNSNNSESMTFWGPVNFVVGPGNSLGDAVRAKRF